MDRKWLPLNALRAFEAAGQHLSFTAAANSLTVAQSAVSRHVIVLENFLGVALFERRPQQLVLTEAGRHILPVVSKSFDRIDQALGEVIKEKGRPKRVLKVALPTSFAHRLAIPILRDFRSENAGISLEIVSKPTTGPEVDGDIDIAIVYSEPRVTDAIHDLLWMVRSTLLCSPKLLEGDRRQRSVAAHRRQRSPASQDRRPAAPFLLGDVRALDRASRSRRRSGPRVRHPAARRPIRDDGRRARAARSAPVPRGDQGRPAGAPLRPLARRRLRLLSHHPSRGPQQRGGGPVPLLAHRALLGGRAARPPEPEPAAAEAPKLQAQPRPPRRSPRNCARRNRPAQAAGLRIGMAGRHFGASLAAGRAARSGCERRIAAGPVPRGRRAQI